MSEVEKNGIQIICLNTSKVEIVLHLNGVTISGNKLCAGDIITDVFVWNKSKLATLSEEIWSGIIQNFSTFDMRDAIIEGISKNQSLVRIYCATEGDASIICNELKCYKKT